MPAKQKLELTWIGKGESPKLEPRILIEDPSKSFGDKNAENMLIHGDNLLALKALEQEFSNRIQCIYIDPPFNTQQAFEHYDDGVEHSVWLSLMYDRLKLLHKLLHPSGSIFIHIDDSELGYLIAVADEIFGRKNRVSVIAFKQSSASGPKAVNPGLVTTTNFVLFYTKDKTRWKSFKIFVPTGRDDRYSKFIENPHESFEKWHLINLKDAFCKYYNATWDTLKARFTDKLEGKLEDFVLANADYVVRTARVAPKDVNEDARTALVNSTQNANLVFRSQRPGKEDYYFLNGEQLLFYRTKTKIINGKLTTAAAGTNVWDDLLSNNLHNEGSVSFPNGKKPEFLIKRVFELSTEKGDFVLDSFLGSGTTAATAHKMGLKWIGIELGEHCYSHCLPRLKKVIDGSDQSGISGAVAWKGGGGFKFYELAPSLLRKDKFGNWVIAPAYNADMLAASMAKHEGFKYCPDTELFWKQGSSTEKDYIFTTTNHVGVGFIDAILDEMKPDERLLICCKSFDKACETRDERINIKKIPKMLLGKCEFGKDDYSLNIVNVPDLNDDGSQEAYAPPAASSAKKGRKPKTKAVRGEDQPSLFGEDEK